MPSTPLHVGLAAELALGTHFLGDARHLRREGVRACPTMVLMVFLSSRISPLASTVIFCERSPLRDRRRDLGDVAHLGGEVRRQHVHVVGQVLPGARSRRLHVGLTAELALGTYFLRDARHLRREGAQLIHHDVDGVLELQDLAARVDRDLLGEVAVGDRRRRRWRCCAPAW